MSTVIKLKGHNRKKGKGKPAAGAAAAAGDLAPEADNALRRALEKIVALNRDSTHHAFELGACFAEIKALVPERGFGRCLKVFTDYTVRSAWNYISIHERLAAYREALLMHAVLPTVMFELAKGEPAQIEAVIARMADGERIKVKDVRETEGIIIVGATNLPERIDPALLRSGRLETHVEIPMPDMEALVGILGHHLGSDLDAVLASAPSANAPRRLRPPPARNGKPPVRRKPSYKPEAQKGPRHD